MFRTIYQDLPGIQPWISLFAAIWNIQHYFSEKKVIPPQKKHENLSRTVAAVLPVSRCYWTDREQME